MNLKHERGLTLSNVMAPDEAVHGSEQQAVFASESTTSGASKSSHEAVCRACGVIDRHRIEAGTGPHGAKLVCVNCDSFVRWLPKNPTEVREANRQAGIRAWMQKQPATLSQLRYLKKLSYRGPKPANQLEASEKIGALRSARGWV